ncbi:hypothetical protein LTR66_016196, partial [Elasticomyces elasticus]
DDKGFWSGVQSLIENTKRPVVLTCNSLDEVPVNELGLHTILHYEPPTTEVVVDYLVHIAAAEGHLIDRSAIAALYRSRKHDLRALMTELDFWCQMTIGSQKGGLDWYLTAEQARTQPPTRVFSRDTYRLGLDIFPQCTTADDAALKEVQYTTDVTYHDIFADRIHDAMLYQSCTPSQAASADIFEMMTKFSDLDMVDDSVCQMMYSNMDYQVSPERIELSAAKVQEILNGRPTRFDMNSNGLLFAALAPLRIERPVFPPAQGRLAPSLDSLDTKLESSLVCDIAPYVRSIGSFDRRLEEQRDELFSSQGKKTRNTRAARAAAEGGSKAETRRERWFPKELDLNKVSRTGGNWPQWYDDQLLQRQDTVSSQTTIATTDVQMSQNEPAMPGMTKVATTEVKEISIVDMFKAQVMPE